MKARAPLFSSAFVGVGILAGAVFAQDDANELSATASVGLAGYINREQSTNSENSVAAYGSLSLRYSKQTPLDMLSFEGGFEVSAPEEQNVHNPYAKANYTRAGANSSLEFGASWSDLDLSDAGNTDDLGVSQGFRTDLGTNAKIRFNTDGSIIPFASLTYSEKSYRDSDTSAVNSNSTAYTVGSEFIVNPITSFNLNYTARAYHPEVGQDTDTDTLSFGVRHDRPLGALRANGSYTQAYAGERSQLSFGRIFQFATGSLDASVGYANATSGDGYIIGDVSFASDISTGTMIFSASRTVNEDSNSIEQLMVTAGINYQAKISDFSHLGLSANFSESENTVTGAVSTSTVYSASYTRQLLEDTSMSFSVNHRIKSTDTTDKSGSAVYVKLTREF